MQVSEVIEALEKIQKIYGDLQVFNDDKEIVKILVGADCEGVFFVGGC